MQIIEKQLTDIRPYEKNPRKNDGAVDYVAASISEFGFKVPIVIDRSGVIVAGHTRYKAAQKLGMQTVPCVVADDLTPEQVKAFRLADNKTGEFAEWIPDLLDGELQGITELDMSLFGFDTTPAGVIEDDYDPVIPENPKSKRGDVYLLGDHRLMCGDSTSLDDVMTLVENQGGCIDELLTDPPYNVDYEGAAGKIKNDSMKDAEFRKFLSDAFSNARAVMRPGAAFHIWHADSEGYNFRGACRDADLKVRQCLIWEKDSLVLGRQDFQWKHEPCLYGEVQLPYPETAEYEDEVGGVALYGWTSGARHYFYKNRKQTTILKFDRPKVSREHPTMKPVLLFDYQMQCNTKPGDKVLDLFGGSGTTIIAAEQNGRKAYVMEFDPKYCDVIIDRWEQFTGKKGGALEWTRSNGRQKLRAPAGRLGRTRLSSTPRSTRSRTSSPNATTRRICLRSPEGACL